MSRMTKEERVANRRKRLRLWIDIHFETKQAAFIEAIDINQGELSGLLNKKSFGEDKARDIEVKAGMPYLWLDAIEDGSIRGDQQVDFSALMSAATPRTYKSLEKLRTAFEENKLTKEDLALLDAISDRITND